MQISQYEADRANGSLNTSASSRSFKVTVDDLILVPQDETREKSLFSSGVC